MKESEAKKKWCPNARTVLCTDGAITQPFNRFIYNSDDEESIKIAESLNNLKGTKCRGSDCMIWEADQKLITKEEQVKIESNSRNYNKHCSDGFKFSHITKHQGTDYVFIELRKYVDADSGDCGLKTKELYCEGCN